MNFPKSITIGNRKVPVKVVDYDTPGYVYTDDPQIEVSKNVDDSLQERRFIEGVMAATYDYLKMLNEMKSEVENPSELSDMAGMSLGAAISKVLADNGLNK